MAAPAQVAAVSQVNEPWHEVIPTIVGIASNPGQYAPSCFGEIRGNVDCDPEEMIEVADLIALVDFMFDSGPTPGCFDEADINADVAITISDLVYLVDYMFTGGPEPPACP